MRNLVVLFRPFQNVEQSAKILSEHDIHLIGKQQTTEIILCFLGRLGIINWKSNLIEDNDNVNYYWNNGQPFLADILEYYETAKRVWPKEHGGDITDFLSEYRKELAKCPWTENRSRWTEEMSVPHAFALMERDFFWYQRYWAREPISWRYRKLKDPSIFVKGSPRKIKVSNIWNVTYESRPDTKKVKK